jgi:4-hydroxy-tetrahydrodipicolinate reductase
MSVVVAILNEMVKDVAGILGGDEFDVEILEEHHKKKKDAPSGTALMLGKTIAEARKRTFSEVARFDRFNDVAQPRVEGEIGFAALRGGSTVGMHEVSFNGVFEKLTLRHDACDVGIFADGALRIARWLKDKKMPPGIYTMHDYLQSFMSKL